MQRPSSCEWLPSKPSAQGFALDQLTGDSERRPQRRGDGLQRSAARQNVTVDLYQRHAVEQVERDVANVLAAPIDERALADG